jgi:hypothetical protein
MTDEKHEVEGIWVDYGNFAVRLARAGGANKRYLKLMEARLAPHKRAIQLKTMDDAVATNLILDVFLSTIIINWAIVLDGKTVEGKMHMPDGTVVDFNKENAKQLLTAIPNIFVTIQKDSSEQASYLVEELEHDAGN